MLDFAFVAASPGNRKLPWLPLTVYYARNTRRDHSAVETPPATSLANAITRRSPALARWLASWENDGNTQTGYWGFA